MLSTHWSISVGGFKITAPPIWLAAVLPLGYFAAAVLSISAFSANTPIWVSNAFVVAALLRNKRSTWPILLFLAAAADYAANAVTGTPIIGLGFVTCDTVEMLLVTVLCSAVGAASPIDGIWPLAKLVLVCLLVPTVSATGGSGLLALVYGATFWAGWKTWYLATACGLLTVTPLLLSWIDHLARPDHSRGQAAQTVLLAGLVAAVGYLVFHKAFPGLFLTFPFLVAAAFNGRLLGATSATAALSAIAIWATLAGHGPIAAYAATDAVTKVQILQLFIAVVLLSTLPVAAILEQREKLTVRLHETTKAAQAAARAKSAFVAVMSHEIRTPMTGVLGMVDLLMNCDLSAKERGYVAGIRASGRHLLALINDILDFSRIDAQKLVLESIDFGIPEVLEQVRSLLAPQAVECGLELRFELDAHSLPVLRGDPTRLKQVLVNLVGNGLKFTQRGDVIVTVCSRVMSDGRILVRFEIRDTGIGIPQEKLAILFSPFSQVDSSTTRQYGGSGLGLAICKQLVEAMGGDIGVESVPRIGSCFWFEVPLGLGDSTAIQAAAGQEFVAVERRRILLVEDVELNRVLIADMLRSHGHDVALAVNGMEAVELAARERFDVVLMDVQMPVMDGVEATHRIRLLPPPAGEVPVIALSANVMATERERYLAAGMNGALTKPIDWPHLFEALAQYGGPGRSAANHALAAGPDVDRALRQRAAASVAAARQDSVGPLDFAVLDRLQSFQNSTGDLIAKLAELFMRDTGQRVEDLRDAVERADAPAVARMAHAIKGSAANLGAQLVVQICAGIESHAEAADLDAASARMDELQHEFTRACNALTVKLAEV